MTGVPVGRHIVLSVVLAAAGTFSAVVALAVMPDSSDDFFTPWLAVSYLWLTLLCGYAGLVDRAGGPYWGIVATIPNLAAFWVAIARHPAPPADADFSPLSFGFLVIASLVPWGVGWAASAARRT